MNIRLIATAPSGGEFPNSVAFNKDASQLCALNTGRINGVRLVILAYTFLTDPLKGVLAAIPLPTTVFNLFLTLFAP